jgi:hypothetical protein
MSCSLEGTITGCSPMMRVSSFLVVVGFFLFFLWFTPKKIRLRRDFFLFLFLLSSFFLFFLFALRWNRFFMILSYHCNNNDDNVVNDPDCDFNSYGTRRLPVLVPFSRMSDGGWMADGCKLAKMAPFVDLVRTGTSM